MKCAFCSEFVDPESPDTYREVTSWVHGPKLDGPKLRDQTGRMAHKSCIDRLVSGQSPDQPVFDFGVTDEPGGVYKITGTDSLHDMIQQRANELQAQGPDEFPRGFYENLAADEIEKGKK